MSYQVLNPESLGAPRGWNHGMLAPAGGRILFVAGQTARDDHGRIPTDDMAEQWERCLEAVMEVVGSAGGAPEHIGRLTIYVTDREVYLKNLKSIGAAYRKVMGRHFPAMALVEVSALVDEGALVEIEATAVLPQEGFHSVEGPATESTGKPSPAKDSPGNDSPGNDTPGKSTPEKDSPGKESSGKYGPEKDGPRNERPD